VNQWADSDRAEALFREALTIDPDFARARGGLCVVYLDRMSFAPQRTEQARRDMDLVVEEALARAPEHWTTHLAHGNLLATRHDWLGADGAFVRMKALAPPSDSNCPFSFGMFLGNVGRSAEALAETARAAAADPLSLRVSGRLQQDLYVMGRSEDARAEYERTLALTGNREPAEHLALMRIWDAGDSGPTAAQFRRFLDHLVFPVPILHQVCALIDRPSAAVDLLRSAFSDPAYQDAARQMVLSWYLARFGGAPLAIAAMRRAYLDLGGSYLVGMWFPFMREVRKLPDFKVLLRDLGIYDYWRKSGKWGDFARPRGTDDFEVW
jgi:Tfp pilus assembly protein PilF